MKIRRLTFDRRFNSTKKFDFIRSRMRFWFRIYAFVFFILFIAYGVWFVNRWFDTHYFVFNPPVEMYFNKPIEIKSRVPEVRLVFIDKTPKLDNLTPIEKYICDKFGVYDCKMALAVARAESNLDEDAFNVNRNGTIDVGIFQINSVHFSRPGCSLKEVADAYKNVDCAYSIWKEQGWKPWTVAKNGRFIKFLKEN